MSRLEQLKAEKARREQANVEQQPSEYPLKQEAQTAPTPMPTPQPQAAQMPQPANRLEALKQERDKRNAQRPVCLLYTSPSPRDRQKSRMPSSA